MNLSGLSLLFLSGIVNVAAQSASYSFGTNPTTDLPAISGYYTSPTELEGAMLKLECANGRTFMSSMTTSGFSTIGGKWYDGNVEVGEIKYTNDGTTINAKMKFDVTMNGGCTGPILTIDLRMACANNIAVVFDIPKAHNPVTTDATTPDSESGSLYFTGGGGGCGGSNIPVKFDYPVGINGAAAVGDLYQLVTMDFRTPGCSFNKNLKIVIDSDSTVPVPQLCTDGLDGDPHVKTWSGKHFDFNGECDIVLLHAPNFAGNGQTLDIHTRTKIRYDYSYIESAAISIDGEILEVDSFGNHALNGVDNVIIQGQSDSLSIAGYPIHHRQLNKKTHIFDVVLGPKENITLSTFKHFVAVHLNDAFSHEFFNQDISGIMGSFDGALVGRDGIDMSDDLDAYADEWQVHDFEPMLFRTARAPQYPSRCILPVPGSAASFDEDSLVGAAAKKAAEEACAPLVGIWLADCVSDVIKLGEVEGAHLGVSS